MAQSTDIYQEIFNHMRSNLIDKLNNKYKDYRLNDHIISIVDNILNDDIDFSKVDKDYKKPIVKMVIETDRIKPDRCLARRLNKGYGGQCRKFRIGDTEFCKKHQKEEDRWCGLITENRQEICYYKGNPHKWKN